MPAHVEIHIGSDDGRDRRPPSRSRAAGDADTGCDADDETLAGQDRPEPQHDQLSHQHARSRLPKALRSGIGLLLFVRLDGSVAVVRDETEWRFTPQQPWKVGDYQIVIQTTLEDLAGNHIGRAFDVDTFDRVTRSISRDTASLSFRIRHQ